jgi:hypothetical protein
MGIVEAKCMECGEVFNPHPQDVILMWKTAEGVSYFRSGVKTPEETEYVMHYIRMEDGHEGEECGGIGVITGEYG